MDPSSCVARTHTHTHMIRYTGFPTDTENRLQFVGGVLKISLIDDDLKFLFSSAVEEEEKFREA
jgi:hypothetical protein